MTLAGQVGMSDHVHIGDHATIIAQTGIAKDVEPRAIMAGSVAMPHNRLAPRAGRQPHDYLNCYAPLPHWSDALPHSKLTKHAQ